MTDEPKNEIVEAKSTGISVDQRVSLVRAALENPDVDPAKAQAMMDLVFRMEDRDRETNFIAAKTEAISTMPRVGKDGHNTHLKTSYAKWETMQPVVTQHLAKFGLSLSFHIGEQGGKVSCVPVLQGHGWTEKGDAMVLPSDTGPGRNSVQAVGSSISYAKRYAAMAMLNIVQTGVIEDDDGAGSGASELPQEKLDLIQLGRDAARDGTEAYSKFFEGLSKEDKGFLTYAVGADNKAHHEANKEAARLFD